MNQMTIQTLKIMKLFYYGTFVLLGLFFVIPIAVFGYWILLERIACESCLWAFGYISTGLLIICVLAMHFYSFYKVLLNFGELRFSRKLVSIFGALLLGPVWGYKIFYDDHIRVKSD